ncbi:MAG: hypothetical protein JWP07_1356 [Pseudonocardiales bacterium]|nr:hypothetical protein [Pseudonocardiales bacterium]
MVRLRGRLLSWWQTFPFANGRVGLEPFDRDTWAEQLGTTVSLSRASQPLSLAVSRLGDGVGKCERAVSDTTNSGCIREHWPSRRLSLSRFTIRAWPR